VATLKQEAPSPAEPSGSARAGYLLLVEDDATLSELLARVLKADGYRVVTLTSTDSLPALALTAFDAVVSDISLEGAGTGYDVLRAVHAASPKTPVILITGFADSEDAMKAASEGAYDYLPKPIDPAVLRRIVGEAVARRRFSESLGAPPADEASPSPTRIIGNSQAIIDVYKTVAQVASTVATVLVVGESGTGKELVAREIHAQSPRADCPFIAVNCAALPESILESELFGHERGAFTGATSPRRGLFEEAAGGTLFLDEIGEVSLRMQAQLLRVLEEHEIRRVGGSHAVEVDVRVLAATNRELGAEVAAGRFREDLLFRLRVVTIGVPPLRERVTDIPPLVEHFLTRHAERLGRPVPRLLPSVLALLEAYSFPGNVRELGHIVERAMLLCRGDVITPEDLPAEVTPRATRTFGTVFVEDWPTLDVLARRYVGRVLVHTDNNKTRAARVLGINRRTLGRLTARARRSPEGPHRKRSSHPHGTHPGKRP
jgi:DNA-binding NtrC family response regulator